MDLDGALATLAVSPTPHGLDAIDGGVFARIAAEARARRQAGRGLLAVTGAASLAGMAAAALPDRTSADALAVTALAPSTLLGDGR